MTERDRIVAEFYSYLGEDAVGSLFDADKVFFRQDVIGRDVANDVRPAKSFLTMRPHLSPRAATAPLTPPARLYNFLGRNDFHRDTS